MNWIENFANINKFIRNNDEGITTIFQIVTDKYVINPSDKSKSYLKWKVILTVLEKVLNLFVMTMSV